MRAWALFVLGWLALFATLWAVSYIVPRAVVSVLMVLFVVGSGWAANVFGSRRRKARRADAPDSVESECARAAAANSFQAALLLVLGLFAWLVFRDEHAAAAAVLGIVVILVVVFWLNYALLRRRA